jgi:hypothetical protein
MPIGAIQSRALWRGCTRVFVARAIALSFTPRQSSMPFQAHPTLSSSPLRAVPLDSQCLLFSTAGVKIQKRPSWLHRARRASGFLQVAPIETASDRRFLAIPGVLRSEAVPIGR